MLNHLQLDDILFIDIETVPQYESFDLLDDRFRLLWEHKAANLKSTDEDTPASLYNRAAIYAEFGRIICISVGFMRTSPEGRVFRIKSFAGHDEKEVLATFFDMINRYYSYEKHRFCAHNGKEFDFPYLCRRALINGLPLPSILDVAGKKPWEVNHLDTMELWKFGDYKNYTSLDLLTAVFNIPTPKDDISGADVWKVYWIEKDLKRIVTYCQKDVLAVAQLFLRYRGEALLSLDQIKIVE